MLTRKEAILVILAILGIIITIAYSANKQRVYTEKCIGGNLFIIGHSGGIAGPLGRCPNE